MVEGIHAALVAFLRTSEHGVWTADTEHQNDEFNLHFIRGNWKKSLFGSKRVAGVGDKDRNGRSLLGPRKPMLLSVTIRPAPSELRICIDHSVFYMHDLRYYGPGNTEAWQGYVHNEAKALSDYLHQYYSLENPPKIESV
jgi:hypothetical protein